MKRLAALLICLAVFVPSLAQDTPPVVTPENAAALTLLESAGSALPRLPPRRNPPSTVTRSFGTT